MKVKELLNHYNIGRSNIKRATVVNTGEHYDEYTYSESELMRDLYGSRFGNLKINSFTITEDTMVIYAE